MSLPIIPLVAPWDSQEEYDARCVDNKFGMGSVRSRDRQDLNRITSKWNIQVNTANYEEIQEFLAGRQGHKPFQFNFDGVNPYPKAYICKQWEWNWLGEEIWGLNATFEEVFRPRFEV
jgi:phage-related protein